MASPSESAAIAPATGAGKSVLVLSTTAFTLLFAVWLMFGVLGKPIRTDLHLTAAQMYWPGAAAVLAGSLLHLPLGILAERSGGRRVMIGLLLWTAIPCLLVAWAQVFNQLLALTPLFGIAGNAFSVGVTCNAAWSKPECKGFALGVFGAGNVGASVTKFIDPQLIALVPVAGVFGGVLPGGWRSVPMIYAVLLVIMAAAVWWWSASSRSANAKPPWQPSPCKRPRLMLQNGPDWQPGQRGWGYPGQVLSRRHRCRLNLQNHWENCC